MRKIATIILILLIVIPPGIRANEGMWLPMFIGRLNYIDMRKEGLKLTAEEIYSVNHSSLINAVVMLNGGSCTAEIISKEGLTLTNHHCAFGSIQAHSTVAQDYMTDGFWAHAKDQELEAEGMTASFLDHMEDVSHIINGQLTDNMSEETRNEKIDYLSDSIAFSVTKNTYLNANVKSFYEGNEFYLFVYTTYRDVRLVGAPPSSIGKFGGDTDNWMWPRHTGDFSLLRIYTGPQGEPAYYSKNNIPLVPKYSLKISMDGIRENDYAMVMGYPGFTNRYLTSWGVAQEVDIEQPARIKIRGTKLDIYKKHMDKDLAVRIKYASKYDHISNYWKYYIGQSTQLRKNHVYEKKQAIEAQFSTWVASSELNKSKYKNALSMIATGYENQTPYLLPITYFHEAAFASEILVFSYHAIALENALSVKTPNTEKVSAAKESLKKQGNLYFKDYDIPTDKEVTSAMLNLYYTEIPKSQQPEYFLNLVNKNKGDFNLITAHIFSKSIFASQQKMHAFLSSANPLRKLQKDPAFTLMKSFLSKYKEMRNDQYVESFSELDHGNRLLVDGLRKMNTQISYAPDANSTMRISYGKVLPYLPYDAIYYDYQSTLKGLIEKMDNKNPEFVVPQKIVDLYEAKDYGVYGNADGTMPVCFITNNDITGGNSGSPVLNAHGELIGVAFDGNWEAMSGDIFFEPKVQRTIVADIRYILFIIDKYADAQNIIDEMEYTKSK